MKYITIEDSVFSIPDKGYSKLEKIGLKELEMLEYDEIQKLVYSLKGKLLGGIYMSFRY